jgi:hypothetical protein
VKEVLGLVQAALVGVALVPMAMPLGQARQ